MNINPRNPKKIMIGGLGIMGDYRQQVRKVLLKTRTSADYKGFQDEHGYIVHYVSGRPNELGEATLYTAIAAIAIATGSYRQDSWEENNANLSLKELLTTLLHHSWGNPDSFGRLHPIRHSDCFDYDSTGKKIRKRPLTKDSFGAIVAAAYYAFNCPNSNEEVRSLAQELMTKWTEYLISFQWKIHSNFIPSELNKDGEHYRDIYGYDPVADEFKKSKWIGPDSYMLLPHELYALQNVAANLGIPTSHWNMPLMITEELHQMFYDVTAPFLAKKAGEVLNILLSHLNFAVPYSIPLGPEGWSYGLVEGVFVIKIPEETREHIVEEFQKVLTTLIRESIRVQNYSGPQAPDVLGAAINRILSELPYDINPLSWRNILTGNMQRVLPWLSWPILMELLTFLATLQLLKALDESEINYTFWSFATECESRPEIIPILNDSLMDFSISLSNSGNPNGLWAWLAGNNERVQKQLTLFETHSPDHWWKFAYGSTKFDDWVKEHKSVPPSPEEKLNKECPRLDYLVLDGLADKGKPSPNALPDFDLEQFYKDVKNAAGNYVVDKVKQPFELGLFMRDRLNELGDLIRETWDKNMKYTLEQFRNENLIHRKLNNFGDKTINEFWNRDNEKYLKEVWKDSSGTAEKMLERVIIDTRDVLTNEYWDRLDTEKYYKGVWSDDSGAAEKMIERVKIDASNVLTHEYWGRDTEKYWKGTWPDATEQAEKMIEKVSISKDDIKEVVKLNNGVEVGRAVYNKAGELIESAGELLGPLSPIIPPIDFPWS